MPAEGVLVEVADAVAADINTAVAAGSFVGVNFRAESSWADVVEDEPSEADGVLVDVVGNNADEGDPLSRSSRKYMVTVEIYVRKKFGQKDRSQAGKVRKAEVNRLVKLVQEVREMFDFKRLGTMNEAIHDGGKILFSWSRKHLRSGVFFGAVRHTFEVIKAIPPA